MKASLLMKHVPTYVTLFEEPTYIVRIMSQIILTRWIKSNGTPIIGQKSFHTSTIKSIIWFVNQVKYFFFFFALLFNNLPILHFTMRLIPAAYSVEQFWKYDCALFFISFLFLLKKGASINSASVFAHFLPITSQ